MELKTKEQIIQACEEFKIALLEDFEISELEEQIKLRKEKSHYNIRIARENLRSLGRD